MHGIALGTGDIIRVGGTYTAVGHMIGTGIIATPSIITITTALSTTDIISTMAIMTCITA